MKRILAILFSSLLLAACGLDHPALSTPVPTSLVASTPPVTAVKSGVTAAPLLPYTSTPSKTCGSYEWGRRIYLDEIPAFAIRQGPGCEYPVALGRLFKTDPLAFFDVLGKQGDWLSVDLCNNAQGWVFSPAINDVNMDVNLDDLPVLAPPATPVSSCASFSATRMTV